MHISIIIPAHNEEKYIADCLYTFVNQSHPPDELVVVDDNSSDGTFDIASGFAHDHGWISVVKHHSSESHLPGTKVIQAFNFGMKYLSNDYDLIGKFDADIMIPHNYFEQMRHHFQNNWLLGMCSGLLYVEKNGKWVYENIANKNHVRGPIKLYYREVFELMGGLYSGTGWDTLDSLLCQYHDFEVKTDHTLKVRHLRPTGHGYDTKNFRQKGEALYKMRYRLPLAQLALLKMAIQESNTKVFWQGMHGYITSIYRRKKRLTTADQGKFIRNLRWKGILKRLKYGGGKML